jgi:hypothetical protein
MTPVELALAVAWGDLFALFAYERWKTPRSVLDEWERNLVRGVGTDLLRAIVNDNMGDRLRPDRVEQAVAEQDAKRFADKLDSDRRLQDQF